MLPRHSPDEIRRHGPCYDPVTGKSRYTLGEVLDPNSGRTVPNYTYYNYPGLLVEGETYNALDILQRDVPPLDRIWVISHFGWLPEPIYAACHKLVEPEKPDIYTATGLTYHPGGEAPFDNGSLAVNAVKFCEEYAYWNSRSWGYDLGKTRAAVHLVNRFIEIIRAHEEEAT